MNACLKARETLKTGLTAGAPADSDLPEGWTTYLAGNWKRPCFGKEVDRGEEIPKKLRSAGSGGCFGCFPDCVTAAAYGRVHAAARIQRLNDTDWSLGQRAADGNAEKSKLFSNLIAVLESLGICPTAAAFIGLHEIAEMFRTCTGFGGTDEELLQIGERIRNLEVAFNRKIGFPE